MLGHETHSLFLGTIPMGTFKLEWDLGLSHANSSRYSLGLVTITSGIARTGTEYGIKGSLDAGLVLWWIALGKFETNLGRICLAADSVPFSRLQL